MTERLELPAWVFTDKAMVPDTARPRCYSRDQRSHCGIRHAAHVSRPQPLETPPERPHRISRRIRPAEIARGGDNGDRWAPCPCCHLHYPKYYKNGMIAWFPDQGLIRMLGPQCFRKLNPEGHDFLALAQYRKEQRIRRDIAFLLGHLHLLPEAMRAVVRGIEIAQAVDLLRAALGTRIRCCAPVSRTSGSMSAPACFA